MFLRINYGDNYLTFFVSSAAETFLNDSLKFYILDDFTPTNLEKQINKMYTDLGPSFIKKTIANITTGFYIARNSAILLNNMKYLSNLSDINFNFDLIDYIDINKRIYDTINIMLIDEINYLDCNSETVYINLVYPFKIEIR